MTQNIAKNLLRRLNNHFREREAIINYKPDENNLKIDRKHGIAKNFMRLLNKTMIGVNRTHINRWQLFAGVFGITFGYICSKTDDFIVQMKTNFQPSIKNALIQHVLRNQEIKKTLNSSLLQNIYTNKEIQYTLHEVLMWKAIKPQSDNLFNLSKQGIIQALTNQSIEKDLAVQVVKAIEMNSDSIANLTFQFLESAKMDEIVATGLKSALRSSDFYILLASNFIKIFNNELMSESNRQNLYNLIRQKFMNW